MQLKELFSFVYTRQKKIGTMLAKKYLNRYYYFYFIFGDHNWRQTEAWNLRLAGAVEVNALAQAALRRFTQWSWSDTQLSSWEAVTLSLNIVAPIRCCCRGLRDLCWLVLYIQYLTQLWVVITNQTFLKQRTSVWRAWYLLLCLATTFCSNAGANQNLQWEKLVFWCQRTPVRIRYHLKHWKHKLLSQATKNKEFGLHRNSRSFELLCKIT